MTRTLELVGAELLKARTSRVALGLLAGAVVLTALTAIAVVAGADERELRGSDGVRLLGVAGTSSTVFSLCLGVIGMAGEHRHGTLSHTLMAAPARWPVALAKVIAYALLGIGLGLAAVVATYAIALPWASARGAGISLGDELALRIAAGTLLANACFAAIGVGLGAVMREQVVALIVGVGWMLIVDGIVPGVLPAVGRFLPGGAQAAVLESQTDGMLVQELGALVLLGYVAAFAAAGTVLLRRRDLT